MRWRTSIAAVTLFGALGLGACGGGDGSTGSSSYDERVREIIAETKSTVEGL